MAEAYNLQTPSGAAASSKINQITASQGRVTDVGLFPLKSYDQVLYLTSGSYWSFSGTTGVSTDRGADKEVAQQALVDLLAAASGGSLFLFENTLDIDVTYGTTVIIVEQYLGRRTAYADGVAFTTGANVSDHTGAGTTKRITVGENVSVGETLYVKNADGKFWLSDANAAASMPIVVIALETALADAECTTLLHGSYIDNSFSWTVGAILYGSATPGELTETPPAVSGDFVQAVAVAGSATEIIFNPSYSMVEVA